jgi:hypothetical protein
VAALLVDNAGDYDPLGAPTTGTLRWALENQSGARDVTVSAGVIGSGITLGTTYGPVIVRNTGLNANLGGVQINYWGLSCTVSGTTIDNAVMVPYRDDPQFGFALYDSTPNQAISNVTISNLTVQCGGPLLSEYPDATTHPGADGFTVQQTYPGSSFRNITFTNITVGPQTDVWASKGVLVSGANFGYVNGEFTWNNLSIGTIGGTQKTSGRIPILAGGLHHFNNCSFIQGWSTGDIQGAHCNFNTCAWTTRSAPAQATYWYEGRLNGVRFPQTTKLYFTGCTLDGGAATANDLCKMYAPTGDVSIPGSCISPIALTTIPLSPLSELNTQATALPGQTSPYQSDDE